MASDSEKMRVLIVVDVQQCFIEGTLGALPGHDQNMQIFKKRISDYVKRVKNSKEYDIIVFTKDSHPPNHSSFQIGYYPPHCSDSKKKACKKRTNYDSLLDTSRNITNMSSNAQYSTPNGDLSDAAYNQKSDGYATKQGKELINEFESEKNMPYDEKITINEPTADEKEIYGIVHFSKLDTSKNIKFKKPLNIKKLLIGSNKSYIIRLNKGELCNFDANGAFYYHIQYNEQDTTRTQELIPVDILNNTTVSEDIVKYSTGLAESIVEWRNNNKKSAYTIEFDVCGLVTNICVVKTCITGVNMFNKKFPGTPVSFKILNEYCYNLHLPFIDNAYKQIQDAGHTDKISFSNGYDAFGFHPLHEQLLPKYAISDPEGFNLYSLLHPSADKKARIVVCGDLLDSTMTTSNPILTELKSFNLFNIHEVIKENSNIKLTLGNRDINKIKCRYLCKLNSEVFTSVKETMDEFNDGNIELSEEKFEQLTKACGATSMPWTHKMNNWYTFWNLGGTETDPKPIRDFKEFDDNYCNQTYNDTEGEIHTGPFHKRFIDIFGADGAKGTMSADKLLETIPYELFGAESKSYTNNYKAFIVLAIFKSMMVYNDKPQPIESNLFDSRTGKFNTKTSINTSLFKGWLCKMYEKSVMCLASIVDKNVFLFSHAGMPIENDFLTELKNFSRTHLSDDNAEVLNDLDKKKNHRKVNKPLRFLLSGGAGAGAPDQDFIVENLNSIVKDYNTYFKDILINPILVDDNMGSNNQGIPTDPMIQLLAYTSGYSNETKKYSSASGPVNLLDYWKTSKHYKILGKKVHQIHGHNPQGFGCDITPLIDESDKQFYGSIVNLDNSNTFMSNNRRKYGSEKINEQSYNYLEIHADGEYTIDTSLLIDFNGFEPSNDNIKQNNFNDSTKNTIVGFDIYKTENKPVKIAFSSKEHLLEQNESNNDKYLKLTALYSNLKQKETYNKTNGDKDTPTAQMNFDRKFSGFVENDNKIVIMTMEPPMKFFVHVHLKKLDLTPCSTLVPAGGYSLRNRRNTNRIQRNRNSKRGYLTTTRKSRNQQKQNKNRKCTCANCRSMRR